MNLLSSRNRIKIFLTKKSNLSIKKKIDLILSPEFYWVRIFEIPVSTSKEALGLLPTLFEDIVSLNDINYKVIKLSDNKFLSFAYSNSQILEYIKKANLRFSQIKSVCFAQTEFQEYDEFTIFDTLYSYSNDGILVKLPFGFVEEFIDIEDKLSTLKLSSSRVDIRFYSNILDVQYIYKLSSVLILIVFINIFRYFSYEKDINIVNSEIYNIKNRSSMPSTLIQTNSIINKFKNKLKNEIKLRYAMEYILNFKKVIKNGKITKISLRNRIISIDFIDVDFLDITKYINKKYTILKDKSRDNIIQIEIKL